MNIKKSILIRVRIAFIAVALFAFCIAAKIGHIQFVEGEKWKKLEEETIFDYKKVKATRGNIISDNGSLLATSLPFYRVAMDPGVPSKKVFDAGIDSLSRLLSNHFRDRSAVDYKRFITDARANGKQYIILHHRKVNHHEKKIMSKWPIFREGRYKGGIVFEKNDIRYKPFSDLSKRTIGYVNEDNVGAGLEYGFNKVLAGQDGEALFQKIAGSTWKPVFDGNHYMEVDGYDIETTIDVNLQDVAETSLYKAMVSHQADKGLVVVMEVKTGYIKAISNLTADGQGGYEEQFNYAVGGSFEPGSTFKLTTMIALLEDANIELSDTVNTGKGTYTFYNHKVRDHEPGGYGVVTIQKAFEVSSNIAMAKLVDQNFGTRPSRFIHYIDKLKLGLPLGLDIPGGAHPKIIRPGDKKWSGITLPWMSYGYGIEISPMHTLALYNAIANNGRMIKPIFVKAIRNADRIVESFEPQTLSPSVCSKKTLLNLQMLLEGVVEQGTANNLRNSHYKIAGKTGTSQLLENGKYTKKYATSFVGYFPAHAPKYSAIVLVINPKGIFQYGNSVAGPVFKDIADNIYSRDVNLHRPMETAAQRKGVFPTIRSGNQTDLVMLANELGISNHSTTEEEWVKTQVRGSSVLWKQNVMLQKRTPDVLGMTFRDALFVLEKAGLRVSYNGKGRVVKQSIAPGTKVKEGNIIYIDLEL